MKNLNHPVAGLRNFLTPTPVKMVAMTAVKVSNFTG